MQISAKRMAILHEHIRAESVHDMDALRMNGAALISGRFWGGRQLESQCECVRSWSGTSRAMRQQAHHAEKRLRHGTLRNDRSALPYRRRNQRRRAEAIDVGS